MFSCINYEMCAAEKQTHVKSYDQCALFGNQKSAKIISMYIIWPSIRFISFHCRYRYRYPNELCWTYKCEWRKPKWLKTTRRRDGDEENENNSYYHCPFNLAAFWNTYASFNTSHYPSRSKHMFKFGFPFTLLFFCSLLILRLFFFSLAFAFQLLLNRLFEYRPSAAQRCWIEYKHIFNI